MGVGHLQPDRAAAEDQQVRGALREVKQRLAGQVRDSVEAAHRRDGRAAAGGHHDPAGRDAPPADLERIGGDEARLIAQHRGAERAKARLAIGRRDGGDHAVDVGANRIPVDNGLGQRHAETMGRPRGLGGVRGGEQRLARNAARVEAIPAHPAALDQRDPQTEPGGHGGDREAGRTGADDGQIVVEAGSPPIDGSPGDRQQGEGRQREQGAQNVDGE